MRPGQVRALAICVLRHKEAIFVFEGRDANKGETFYRPLGGTIEFGEHSSQTVVRELREEISTGIINLRYLGMLENIFTYEGQRGHEIVLVYLGDFADATMYDTAFVIGKEDNGVPFKALWKPLADFAGAQSRLYPDGLLQLLMNE